MPSEAEEMVAQLVGRELDLRESRRMLAIECHATILLVAPQAADWDAARLCRRYMELPEPYEAYLRLREGKDA